MPDYWTEVTLMASLCLSWASSHLQEEGAGERKNEARSQEEGAGGRTQETGDRRQETGATWETPAVASVVREQGTLWPR